MDILQYNKEQVAWKSMEENEVFEHINIEKGKEMFDDDIEIYKEIAKVFCKNAPKQIETMVKSIEKEDYATYGREVHTLKSLAGNLGAEDLAKIAIEHDAAYKRKDYLFLKNSYWEVISLYGEVVRELKKLCGDITE